ncbi:hypothetical protein BLOT_001855 [Blomia tropicalis]|nr:hypothetical protein BLOT_001855 [Blomia tropicalis]
MVIFSEYNTIEEKVSSKDFLLVAVTQVQQGQKFSIVQIEKKNANQIVHLRSNVQDELHTS